MVKTRETSHDAPDGTRLAVTFFLPENVSGAEPAPALVQRTPYGRPTEPPTDGFPARALDAGYAVAFADTRGRGTSDGRFEPWVHEATDGAATVEWLADRPFVQTGDAVGMFGGSSPGQVQLFAASERPSGLGAIAPTFTPSDLHRADFFQDGACAAMTLLTWSLDDSVAGHTVDRLERRGRLDAATADAVRAALDDALERIDELARHRPFREVPRHVLRDVSLPNGVTAAEIVPHWDAWLGRPTYDEFWRSFDPEPEYDQITVPGLHTTGWYELCHEGTVTNYRGPSRASDAPQHLVIGPWAHQNQGRVVGEVDFGSQASADAYERTTQLLAFFDTYLRDDPRAPFDDPAASHVETLRMCATGGEAVDDPASDRSEEVPAATHRGTGEWVTHDDWPPSDATRETWYLSSDGNATGADDGEVGGEAAASADETTGADDAATGGGRLTREPPGKFEPADEWTHDPRDPVPTRGGPLCCQGGAGAFDRRDLQRRPDVATYTTEPFDAPLELAGSVDARVTLATDAADTDLVAVLTHHTADRRAFEICEGVRRLRYRHGRDRPVSVPRGEPVVVPVNMWTAGYRVPAGDRLCLEVASSNAPRFDPHPGTREPWAATESDARTAEQTLFHELDRESRVAADVL